MATANILKLNNTAKPARKPAKAPSAQKAAATIAGKMRRKHFVAPT